MKTDMNMSLLILNSRLNVNSIVFQNNKLMLSPIKYKDIDYETEF